ncbi:MAG TPA: gamma-glutamyl-gamma-aminobutyrate hydrolase family protein [Gemmatimonadaceae bacterium]|jgi:putative glutamine amidotransferase|nr:gamma-glutamyl-gamma-aminobutyrate hydrolase family protein [Gemmatimonadaceae bacterium]
MSKMIAISATADASKIRLSLNYARSIEGAGLIPVIVPPLSDPTRVGEILDSAGGLLITGGEDVDPTRYGTAPHPKLGEINPARDATELALIEAARARKLPLLAICRGPQILNVAFGGTLYQDLPSERPSDVNHNPSGERDVRTHDVHITPATRLADATGATAMRVNSYHHQAIDRLGYGLRVTAVAPDGVIEGVEGEDPSWWILAVQWHPEDLTADAKAWDRGIFKAFADEIARHA